MERAESCAGGGCSYGGGLLTGKGPGLDEVCEVRIDLPVEHRTALSETDCTTK